MHHSRSHTQETQHAISTEIKHPEDYPIAQRETLTPAHPKYVITGVHTHVEHSRSDQIRSFIPSHLLRNISQKRINASKT